VSGWSRTRWTYTREAEDQLAQLQANPAWSKRFKSVRKALGLLAINPRHPRLQTHKYQSLKGPKGEDVFEAYAENQTPAAFRIFWFYGPVQGRLTVIAITPHP
jgi:hypothetical protein